MSLEWADEFELLYLLTVGHKWTMKLNLKITRIRFFAIEMTNLHLVDLILKIEPVFREPEIQKKI